MNYAFLPIHWCLSVYSALVSAVDNPGPEPGSFRCQDESEGYGRGEGVITKVLKDAVYIRLDAPVKRSVRIIFDPMAEFGYCSGDDPERGCTIDDLKVGRHLETVGFVLGKSELRATRALSIQNH